MASSAAAVEGRVHQQQVQGLEASIIRVLPNSDAFAKIADPSLDCTRGKNVYLPVHLMRMLPAAQLGTPLLLDIEWSQAKKGYRAVRAVTMQKQPRRTNRTVTRTSAKSDASDKTDNQEASRHHKRVSNPPSIAVPVPSQSVWIWECELDFGVWVKYDNEICASLEQAWKLNLDRISFTRDGVNYEASFSRMTQRRCDKYATERIIRRAQCNKVQPTATPPAESKDGATDETLAWNVTPVHIRPSTRKYILKASAIGTDVSRETDEFNRASAHFSRLLRVKDPSAVTQVDVYESDTTRSAFNVTRRGFDVLRKSTKETWVFHGTDDANMESIMSTGFKVGGRDPGVPIANGAVHGQGVYTATGPSTPMMYASRGNKVILARGIRGNIARTESSASVADSWEPRNDWLVFKTGEQLLPVYVVHYAKNSVGNYSSSYNYPSNSVRTSGLPSAPLGNNSTPPKNGTCQIL